MKCLIGVGVGPGDPELMTLLAVRTIRESDVILVPGNSVEESLAYRIAAAACPEISLKELAAVPMPMTKDPELLKASHESGAAMIIKYLDEGRQVSFLTLGDATVYSTYMYLHRLVQSKGYPVRIVNGITSFCAAASLLNISLVDNKEELHILPASYQIEEGLKQPGTKVLMKSGKRLTDVKALLKASGMDALMVENYGMENEKIYRHTDEIPDDAGYFSLLIVKEKEDLS